MKLLDSIGTSVEYLCNRLDKASMMELADALDKAVRAVGSPGTQLQDALMCCFVACCAGSG